MKYCIQLVSPYVVLVTPTGAHRVYIRLRPYAVAHFFAEHQLPYSGDVLHCLDAGIHPSHRERLKSGLGKCWAAQLSFMKNGDTEERGTEIAGGLQHSRKSGTCWLSGVFLCLWPAQPPSIISASIHQGLFSHTGPAPECPTSKVG